MKWIFALAGLISVSGVAAADNSIVCAGVESNEPEISAIYVDNFGGWHSVGGEAWLSFGSGDQLLFTLCSVDNEENFIIAKNSSANDYNPNLYSRFEWHGENGQLFYCQQVYDAASPTEAANFTKHPAADATDANDEGCGATGQFAWSQLSLIRR